MREVLIKILHLMGEERIFSLSTPSQTRVVVVQTKQHSHHECCRNPMNAEFHSEQDYIKFVPRRRCIVENLDVG